MKFEVFQGRRGQRLALDILRRQHKIIADYRRSAYVNKQDCLARWEP